LILLHCTLVAVLTIITYPFDYKRKVSHLMYKFLCSGILFYAGIKVKVKGIDNLKENEVYLYLANHQSYFDIPVLMKVLPGNVRFVYKKSMTNIPIFGWAMYLAGYIPIDRKNARSAIVSLRKAAESMKKGISIVMFPEGTRTPDGEVKEFKKGMAMLASMSDSKVVPVSISGTFEILPRNSFKIKPGNVSVTVSSPVAYSKDKDFLDNLRKIVIENKRSFQDVSQ
jgi:1-acyl-sn-glycerol-3-phosphate acyltransferase